VFSLAWVDGGAGVVSGSLQGVVRYHDADTAEARELFRPGLAVNALAWSERTRVLAAACRDGTIRLFDLDREEVGARLTGHWEEVFGVAWSPDGSRLASAATDGTLRLWQVQSAQDAAQERSVPLTLGNTTDQLLTLAWSPDGRYLAAAGRAAMIFVWGADSDDVPTQWPGHTEPITSLAYSADGRFLASKSFDGTVRLWRADSGEQALEIAEPVSRTYITGLAFHPTEPLLATLGGRDRVVRIWRLVTQDSRGRSGSAPRVASRKNHRRSK
jgi:WD40 repeat protein